MSARELHIGIVGVGVMGEDHARRVALRVGRTRLVAVSDPDAVRAAAVAAQFDGVRVSPSADELIAADDVDAVIIASPGAVHEEQVMACLKARKYVLCEKPLTMDSASSLRLVQAEQNLGERLVQVGFMRRFDPEMARVKAVLESGELGRTLLLHNTHRNKDAPDSFRSEKIVRDSLVHEVDVARFLFGQEIQEITVLSPAPSGHSPDGVIDPQIALFRMSGGGIVTNEVFVRNQVGYEVRSEAVCERGSVMAGRAWTGVTCADYRERFAQAYDLQVQAWAQACLRGEVIGPSMWDGYAATAVCEAGVASLATGRPVTVGLVDRQAEGITI